MCVHVNQTKQKKKKGTIRNDTCKGKTGRKAREKECGETQVVAQLRSNCMYRRSACRFTCASEFLRASVRTLHAQQIELQ